MARLVVSADEASPHRPPACSTAQMAVAGLYSVDYRIVCACRNGNVYSIKNGELSGSVIELESMPCGLVRAA